jgi:hypothetical protein
MPILVLKNKMKLVLKYSFLIILLNCSFLFSPKPISKNHFCGEYLNLGKHAGFVINCDAYAFVGRSMKPSRLMEQNEIRQSRPLYILLGSVTGYGIYYISTPFKFIHNFTIEETTYLGYVLINFFILLSALFLFDRIATRLTNDAIPKSLIFILSIFIVSNFVTKAFFWTAHQQMFTFLTPLLSIYICIEYIQSISKKRMLLLSLLLGIGLLIYGNFLICFAAAIIYYAYHSIIQNKHYSLSQFAHVALCLILFLIPTISWILILKLNHITYYSHELVAYKQLIWIIETLNTSITAFILAATNNIHSFFQTVHCLYPFLALLIATISIRKYKTSFFMHLSRETGIILLNVFCFLTFYIMLGFYDARLTFTIMPVLLCLTVSQFTQTCYLKKMQVLLLAIAIIWHYINVTSYGPFS